MIQKFKIQTSKSARYFQIGEINNNTKSIWIVLHGYGMLPEYFIKKLAPFWAIFCPNFFLKKMRPCPFLRWSPFWAIFGSLISATLHGFATPPGRWWVESSAHRSGSLRSRRSHSARSASATNRARWRARAKKSCVGHGQPTEMQS